MMTIGFQVKELITEYKSVLWLKGFFQKIKLNKVKGCILISRMPIILRNVFNQIMVENFFCSIVMLHPSCTSIFKERQRLIFKTECIIPFQCSDWLLANQTCD